MAGQNFGTKRSGKGPEEMGRYSDIGAVVDQEYDIAYARNRLHTLGHVSAIPSLNILVEFNRNELPKEEIVKRWYTLILTIRAFSTRT